MVHRLFQLRLLLVTGVALAVVSAVGVVGVGASSASGLAGRSRVVPVVRSVVTTDAGSEMPGVVRNGAGTWRRLTSGLTDRVVAYGNPGDVPVVGDWTGGGHDGVGVVRNGVWYPCDSLTSGVADRVVAYGNPGDVPVVGDWTGGGHDGVGVVRNGVWYLRDSLTSGVGGQGDRLWQSG